MAPLHEDSGEERLARLDEAVEREAAARLDFERRWEPWAHIVSGRLGMDGTENLASTESSESFGDWRQFVHEKMLPQSSEDAAPFQVQGSALISDCRGATETLQSLASQACIIGACGDIDVCEVEDCAASGGVAALEVLVRQLQQPQHSQPLEPQPPKEQQHLQQLAPQGQIGKQERSQTPTGHRSQPEQVAFAV